MIVLVASYRRGVFWVEPAMFRVSSDASVAATADRQVFMRH
jgi:hypothetical protein